MKTLQLKKDYHNRLLKGHMWAWRNDFPEGILNDVESGEIVRLVSWDGTFMGIGFANPISHIAFRMFDRKGREPSEVIFRERIESAFKLRKRVRSGTDVYRLVFGESDLLPGLVVDCYSKVIVISQTVAGMERWTDTIVDILKDIFHPEVIILKNTSLLRRLEGLRIEKKVIKGCWNFPIEVVYDGVKVLVDCFGGRKTGLFLDHRENRILLSKIASDGDNVLDLYSNCGLWSLVLRRSAKCKCICIDSDMNSIELGQYSAGKNEWEDDILFFHMAVDDFLSSCKEKFDIVIVDPPAFAKKKRYLKWALATYNSLIIKALYRVRNGGILVASSCSSFVSEATLLNIVKEGAAKNGYFLQLIGKGCQALDHPVLPHMPETNYLKCLFFRVFS